MVKHEVFDTLFVQNMYALTLTSYFRLFDPASSMSVVNSLINNKPDIPLISSYTLIVLKSMQMPFSMQLTLLPEQK